MRSERPSTPERRQADTLIYDAASGRLELGTLSTTLPEGTGNVAVLESYVDLAGRCRGDRLEALVDVRQSDLEALANALDLEAEDLTAQVEAVLGASREQAQRLVERLREFRLIGGLAAAATGAVLAGTFVVGLGGGDPAPAPKPTPAVASRPAPTPAPTTPDGEPIVEGADGVGLIPPASVDAEPETESSLIPPANIDLEPGD